MKNFSFLFALFLMLAFTFNVFATQRGSAYIADGSGLTGTESNLAFVGQAGELAVDTDAVLIDTDALYLGTNIDTDTDISPATYIQITTPDNDSVSYKLKISASASAAGTLYINENPTVSGGSTLTLYNANRNGSNTSGLTTKYAVTVEASGTTIASVYLQAASTGIIDVPIEIELKNNEDYLIEFLPAADNGKVSLIFKIVKSLN